MTQHMQAYAVRNGVELWIHIDRGAGSPCSKIEARRIRMRGIAILYMLLLHNNGPSVVADALSTQYV